MSSVLAVPLPQSKWSIESQWIGAYVAGQAICIGTATAAYGLALLIGANDPAASSLLKSVSFGLAIATELIFAVAITMMRGLVLRQVIPAFPIRLWLVVVVAMMMALHVVVGSSAYDPAAARPRPDMTPGFLVIGLLMSGIAGLIMGLIFGTVEALVVRRAADGAMVWALMTGAAWGVGTMLMMGVGGLMMLYPGLSPALVAVVGGATKIAGGAVVALVTLPALKGLRPRQSAV